MGGHHGGWCGRVLHRSFGAVAEGDETQPNYFARSVDTQVMWPAIASRAWYIFFKDHRSQCDQTIQYQASKLSFKLVMSIKGVCTLILYNTSFRHQTFMWCVDCHDMIWDIHFVKKIVKKQCIIHEQTDYVILWHYNE